MLKAAETRVPSEALTTSGTPARPTKSTPAKTPAASRTPAAGKDVCYRTDDGTASKDVLLWMNVFGFDVFLHILVPYAS